MCVCKTKLPILLLLQTSLVAYGCQYVFNGHLNCSFASLHFPAFNADLKILNASHNKILYLKQESYYELTRVKQEVVELKSNDNQEINHVPSKQQSQLEVIDLSWNLITYIHPDSFLFASKLKWLSLSNNRNLQLPHDGLFFIGNTLKSLYLNHCNITDIGEYMFKPGKHNLKELYLDHNAIMMIHKRAFVYFEMLQILDISYNKIILVDVKMMIPLIKVQSLRLKNNPLVCDCSVRELYSWSFDQEVVLDNVTCRISQNIIIPWSEMFENVKCEIRNVRNRREATEKDPPIVLIIVGVAVVVLVLVLVCACLLNNTHECMETAGCLLICHHCYQ